MIYAFVCFMFCLLSVAYWMRNSPVERQTVLHGIASYYDGYYVGRTMANGKPYDPLAMTLACSDLPLGTRVMVSHVDRDKNVHSAEAIVTDRGPAKHFREEGRLFDLSYALFRELDEPWRGLIPVTVTVLDAPNVTQ